MALVSVDYSEFETLKNRVKELEETVKEKDKAIASLKDGSRVIIRKEVQIEYIKGFDPFERTHGSAVDNSLYSHDEKPRRTVETSESYVNFEDVRLKVEEYMKSDIERSIRDRNETRDRYQSLVEEYEKKKKEFEDKEKSLKDEYDKKKADVISKYEKKSDEIKDGYLSMAESYKQTMDAKYKLYIRKAGCLRIIDERAKQALSLFHANRFFKPKGVDNLLEEIIRKCEECGD